MNVPRSTLPVRLELNLQKDSIMSSLYCREEELHFKAGRPDGKAVADYQKAISLGIMGDDSGRGDCHHMRDAILGCLPPGLPALLQRLTQSSSKGLLVELEIGVNDRELENYPWELLAEPGVLTPPGADVAVWRSVTSRTAERQASTAILLIGSASLDLRQPFTYEEVTGLDELLKRYPWTTPIPHHSIPFGKFSSLLDLVHPAVVHVVVHGTVDGFKFQSSGSVPESHYDITAQELAGRLARSATSVVVLDACDSATASPGSDPVARRISLDAGTTTIGMAAELPAKAGIPFATQFYQDLVLGATALEAYSNAVGSIRTISGSANLWSVPVMYSTEPNLVIFPADPRARARLSFNEVRTHLAALEAELDGLAGHRDWTPGDWAENTAASAMRVAYVRDAIATLTKTLEERPADLLYVLRLLQECDALETSLEGVSTQLHRLTAPSSSQKERAKDL
jgi:hypothetical protein